jgi:peptide/nickel transport system substrate-binding protein
MRHSAFVGRRSRFPRVWAPLLTLTLLLSLFGTAVTTGTLAQTDPDTLVVAVSSDMQNLDPTLSSGDTATQEMLTNVYEWLIDYEVVDQPDGTKIAESTSFVGGLAEKFEWSEDGTKVTFTLRPDLKFSNGDPLTAEAVKFTFDRIFGQGGVTVGNMAMAAVPDAEHVQIVDERTIEMTLDTPNTLLFGNMAQFGNSILNPAVVEPFMTEDDPYAHEWLESNTTGTEQGPFILESWEPGNQWVLARNENYWGEPPLLERIIFKIIPDPSSRLAQLQSGAVDVAYEIPRADLALLEGDPNVQVIRDTTRTVVYLGMNNELPPFDNKLVRQAISYAIPYDTIVNDVLLGYGQQLTSPIPDGTPTHTDEFFVYENNPEKARELLAEAGFPDGFETTLQIPSGIQEARETAVWVQQSLAEAGITVTIQELPGAAFSEQLQKHELGFFFTNTWISINNDPWYHLYWLFQHPCCNYTNYSNDEVNALIDELTLSTDEEARAEGSLEAQRIIIDEAPWVFLYQPEKVMVMRSNVSGYVFYSTEGFIRYKFMDKE